MNDITAEVPQDAVGELEARYADDNKLANPVLNGAGTALNDHITVTANPSVSKLYGAMQSVAA
jgi:hypothetical protein